MNLSPKVLEQIKQNHQGYVREQVQEETERLQEEMLASGNESYLPELEILMAYAYLRDLGFPETSLPPEIVLAFETGQPRPPTGSIFHMTVASICRAAQKDFDDEGDDASDEDDEEDHTPRSQHSVTSSIGGVFRCHMSFNISDLPPVGEIP